MELIDFSHYTIDMLADYQGSDAKRGIIYNGSRYMLKVSSRIMASNNSGAAGQFSNSSFSEYIGCNIFKSIGIPVQNTLLGFVKRGTSSADSTAFPVIACENFIPEDCVLVEFKFIYGAVTYEKPGKLPRLSDVYEVMLGNNQYFSKSFGEEALKRFWDTFIIDALTGNFDRHANNWGYLINKNTNEISLAPVYDCGSCLFPQLTDDAIPSVLSSDEEIRKRVEQFPSAALTDKSGKKISYSDFISSFENKDCTDALVRLMPRIDLDKINRIIDDIDVISDLRKIFYKTILKERYNKILLAPFLTIKNI